MSIGLQEGVLVWDKKVSRMTLHWGHPFAQETHLV